MRSLCRLWDSQTDNVRNDSCDPLSDDSKQIKITIDSMHHQFVCDSEFVYNVYNRI